MPKAPTTALLERLRRRAGLRALAVCAAILASQNVVACAIDEACSSDAVELVADAAPVNAASLDEAPADDSCCALCTDCAHSGCCGAAASPRSGAERFTLAPIHDNSLKPALSAPASWTPPTLLRPPIDAA